MGYTLEQRIVLAQRALGNSVVAINHDVAGASTETIYVGIKDTECIPDDLIETIKSSSRYRILTIDKMSDFGRSVDSDLVNPLTFSPMTGSTSGGPINILKGITDVCIGTDGGGSVLAPALATNLYSFLGTGIGLTCTQKGISTDGIPLSPGVGVIGASLESVIDLVKLICQIDIDCSPRKRHLKLVLPAPSCKKHPSRATIYERIQSYLKALSVEVDCVTYPYIDMADRKSTVNDLKHIWREDPCAIVVSFEGPIDYPLPEESIRSSFRGLVEEGSDVDHTKLLCKSINIAGGTAITIPADEIASGLLLAAAPGLEQVQNLVFLAKEIDKITPKSALFEKYFLNHEKALTIRTSTVF